MAAASIVDENNPRAAKAIVGGCHLVAGGESVFKERLAAAFVRAFLIQARLSFRNKRELSHEKHPVVVYCHVPTTRTAFVECWKP